MMSLRKARPNHRVVLTITNYQSRPYSHRQHPTLFNMPQSEADMDHQVWKSKRWLASFSILPNCQNASITWMDHTYTVTTYNRRKRIAYTVYSRLACHSSQRHLEDWYTLCLTRRQALAYSP